MPRICVDGFNLAIPRGTGIASYSRNLLATLDDCGHDTQVFYGMAQPKRATANESRLAEGDTKAFKPRKLERFSETFLSRWGRSAQYVPKTSHVIWDERKGGAPVASGYWFNPSFFNYAWRAYNAYGTITPLKFEGQNSPDFMHWTCPLPAYGKGKENITTFHDLIPLILPYATGDDKVKFYELCKSTIDRSSKIVAVSETTAIDLHKILDVPLSKIHVTYQSADLPDIDMSDAEVAVNDVQEIFGLDWKKYFLHYGAVEPKKNLGRIVEAYLTSKVNIPLVLVGGRAWLEKDEVMLLEQIRERDLPSNKRIFQFQYLPRRLLVSLIRGARAALFPSLYEGFGLPVLESMQLSTAVLTSTAGSLPEVAGNAAIICDPYDIDQLANGIKALARDDDLTAELVSMGLVRAKHFSQKEYAARLREVYR